MLWQSFQITGNAVAQIFILGAAGYFFVKRNILAEDGLRALSRLVVEVVFPLLIFTRLVKNFSFQQYPNWWQFPLISIAITLAGLAVGYLFLKPIKGAHHRRQFLGLIAFQNSGYLPLGLLAAILAPAQVNSALIYLFLLLLGFDLVIWSFGVWLLTAHHTEKFELGSLFSPPVVANILSLIMVKFGWNRFIPGVVMSPLELIAACALPLAMFIVGGNIAAVHLRGVDKKAMSLVLLGKLIVLPALGLWLVLRFQFPQLMGLLILMQLAMPPATSLSVITRHYHQEDLLVSQGIFFGHIFSLFTIPLFLSLYFSLVMIK